MIVCCTADRIDFLLEIDIRCQTWSRFTSNSSRDLRPVLMDAFNLRIQTVLMSLWVVAKFDMRNVAHRPGRFVLWGDTSLSSWSTLAFSVIEKKQLLYRNDENI